MRGNGIGQVNGACWQGWALAMQDQDEVGLAQIRQGMAAVLATGQTLTRPLYLVHLHRSAWAFLGAPGSSPASEATLERGAPSKGSYTTGLEEVH